MSHNKYGYNNNKHFYDNTKIYGMDIDDDSKKEQVRIQCQEKLNMQLFMRRQKNYSDTFKSCYYSMKDYLDNPTKGKGNFSWTLECFCSMVNHWNKDYPEYEPQLSKEFNKQEIKMELNNLATKSRGNKMYESGLFTKFYNLLNGKEQQFENEDKIMSHFNCAPPTQDNTMESANYLLELGRKVDRENEKEEFYGYQNFDVDPKIRHLRNDAKK